VAQIDSLHRDRIRSLQAVDREVGALVRTARAAGVLDTTYLVFTSDNGFHLGQHRLPAGKYSAYDTDIRVPLLVRGPGIPAGGHVHAITGNVDLAPTFEAMAGARRPSSNDGRSLLRLARDPDRADRWPRNAFLVEHRQEVGVPKPARADVLPVEPGDPEVEPIAPVGLPTAPATPTDPVKLTATQVTYRSLDSKVLRRTRGVPNYDAVRTSRWLYVEYANGERELYDVRLDPDQLVNLAGLGHVSVESTLRRRLDALRSCRGRTCRAPTAASAVGAS
jgi:arylsulfatase A-like enzyme